MAKRWNNVLFVGIVILIAVFMKIFQYVYLPAKYFYDSGAILNLIYSNFTFNFGDSYNITAILSRFINIFKFNSLLEWSIFFAIIYNIALLRFIRRFEVKSIMDFIFLFSSVALLNLYVFNLSKEIYQFSVFLLVAIVISKFNSLLKKIIFAAIILFIWGLLFRVYYCLIAAFILMIYLSFNLQFNKYKNIKAFLLVAFGLWIALFFIRLLMPSEYAVIIIARSMVTDVLFGSDDARTTMLDFFENTGSPILLTLNTYISVSRLLIPLELLLIGFNIQYFIFLFYQIIVTSFLYKAFINFKKLYLSNTQKAAFIIYAGFLIGSALFEPGFGSWIRHQSAAQPVLFTLIWSTNDLEIKERNKMRVSAYLKNA